MYMYMYVCIQKKKEKQLIYLEIAFCIKHGIFIAEELRHHAKRENNFVKIFIILCWFTQKLGLMQSIM